MNIFRNENEPFDKYIERIGNHYALVIEACDYYCCEAYNQFQELADRDYHLYWEDLAGCETKGLVDTAMLLYQYILLNFRKQFHHNYLDYQMVNSDGDNMNTEINKVIIHD